MRQKWIPISICTLCASLPLAEAHADARPTITVSGEAVVLVVPNKILVTLGVEAWDKNLATAKSRNDTIMTRATAALRQAGVAANAIETDNLAIGPDWGWIDTRDRSECHRRGQYCEFQILGYEVTNRFVVTLTEAKKVEEIVSKAFAAGVNRLYDVDFQTTEVKKHREQAREMAMRAAKEKAQKMALALGQSIGEAVQVSEGSFYSGYSSHWGGGSSRMRDMSQNWVQNASPSEGGAGSGSDTVALGKIAIRAKVDVVFVLKPN